MTVTSIVQTPDNVNESKFDFLNQETHYSTMTPVDNRDSELRFWRINTTKIAFINGQGDNSLIKESRERIETCSSDSELESKFESNTDKIRNPKSFIHKIKEMLDNFLHIDFDMDINSKCAVNCLLILFLVTLSSLPITMFPRYNLIEVPENWPQELLPYALICVAFIPFNMFELFLVTNKNEFLTTKVLFMSVIIVTFTVQSEYILINVIWIYSLKYHPPIPYVGQMSNIGLLTSMSLSIWFSQPKSFRAHVKNRKQLKWYLVLLFTRTTIVYQGYLFMTALFEKFSNKYQVALAFATPLMKYGNNWIQSKIVENCKGENIASAKFSVNCNVACTHALYLALVIGSTATNLTSFVICGLDALLGVLLCFKIHRKSRNSGTSTVDLQKQIDALVTKEALEILLPFLYCIIFVLSYFGPNAEIFGNVKADIWQYEKVEDITTPIYKLGLFLLFDITRITIAAVFLWLTCKIHFFDEYCRLMGYYWKPITLNIFIYVLAVSKKGPKFSLPSKIIILMKFLQYDYHLFIIVFQCLKCNAR